ncbi:alpha-(1,3)-fucosyltransferase fut-6-like [Mya arenaria]|uniref:alpha-(1,3)-fucosyltransferase fut-6-like n=1 Tax=Mya arenaria TaxID=6604 RepID=UPI0022E3EC6E|nr:alpha-(1,3)-fucosyltransferase fut-6-like [Mya arenaria]
MNLCQNTTVTIIMIPMSRYYSKHVQILFLVFSGVSVFLLWMITHSNTLPLIGRDNADFTDVQVTHMSFLRHDEKNMSDAPVRTHTFLKASTHKLKRKSGLENLFEVQTRFNNGFISTGNLSSKKRILWYNKDPWTNITETTELFDKCTCRNCAATDNVSDVNNVDAVLFTVSYKHMGRQPPFKRGKPDQIWIFKLGESPYGRDFSEYSSPQWQNQVNWSSSLNLDSDIPHGAGFIKTRTQPIVKDYDAIFDTKNETALWLVSNCRAQSKRDMYVKKLQASGLDVDIYGACGNGRVKEAEMEKIIPKYKFYLAFENSFCSDYITEKFFMNYNNDWILVTRGGADYRKVIPTQTYINSADFDSPQKLADYLKDLANDRDRYVNLLKEKDKYEAQYGAGWLYFLCELCHRLNYVYEYRHSYPNIADHLQKDRCFNPTDI